MFLMAYSAVDRDLGEKASGRYAAGPVPQLPAQSNTEHLVDAIARGYEVILLT